MKKGKNLTQLIEAAQVSFYTLKILLHLLKDHYNAPKMIGK